MKLMESVICPRLDGLPVAAMPRRIPRAVRAALLLMLFSLLPSVQAEISQQSLINKDVAVVEPNLMFTLDDSGSMAFNYLPDTDLEYHLFAFHPDEPDDYAPYKYEGLLATDDTNILAIRRRSPKVNTLYYDPDTRYEPWVDKNGVRMANADPRAVIYHVNHPNEKFRNLKLDITGERSVGRRPVCVKPQPDGFVSNLNRQEPCKGDGATMTVIPATYYLPKNPEFKPNKDWTKDSASNYERVSIKDKEKFYRPLTRTDCLISKDNPSVRECSQKEEYQNFANWFQYHRTRMHVAIAAVGNAFATALGPDIRVGYGRINQGVLRPVDGEPTIVVERGVRRFVNKDSNAKTLHMGQTDRSDFFDWLNTRTADGGTPLMRAMHTVNNYFRRSDAMGPWAAEPGMAGRKMNEPGNHLACRRSYHILMTDGQYTFAQPDSGREGMRQIDYQLESDNVNGQSIPDDRPPEKGGPARGSYQYRPEAPYKGEARGSLADYAMDGWKNDLRKDLNNEVPTYEGNPSFWQNVTTYTLGFGVEGTLSYPDDLQKIINGGRSWPGTVEPGKPTAIDDLWHAAVNGHGKYVNVRNSAGFMSEMAGILADIASRTGTSAGVAVASRAMQANNQKFVPSYKTKDWTGDLKAYAVDAHGQQGALQWSVLDHLPKPIDRPMFVGTGIIGGPAASPFYWERAAKEVGSGMSEMSGRARSELIRGAGKDGKDGSDLVLYLRGDRSESGKKFRTQLQTAVIGHIVNSQPAYIGAAIDRGYRYLPATLGSAKSGADSYRDYVAQKVARTCSATIQGGAAKVCGPAMVLVGSNEGFLHGFNAHPDPAKDGGREIFAFAPFASLSELGRSSKPDFQARFMMDGPLIERDAYWGNRWHNVVVGTTGAGPKAVFALDVTNTEFNGLKSSVLWELSDANQSVQANADAVGHVLHEPEVGVLADGRWVVVVGNGYESRSKRAQLLVVELQTGRVIARLDTGVGSDSQPNGLGGVALVRDGNQLITGAFAGDLRGNVWKFDLASTQPSEWKVSYGKKPMYTVQDGRAITAAPVTVTHPLGGVVVLVGTGKLFEVGDNKVPAGYDRKNGPFDALYGLWDSARLSIDRNGNRIWMADDKRNPDGTTSKGNDGIPIKHDTVITRRLQVNPGMTLVKIPLEDSANRNLDWTRDRGWRVTLKDMIAVGGQRNIVTPQLMSGLVLFETMSPWVDEVTAACKPRIDTPGFALALDPLSGRMSPKALIDTNNDKLVDGGDAPVAGWELENWTGRSVVVTQPPAKPCGGLADCKPLPAQLCPEDSLANSLQNVGDAVQVCVGLPAPTRWWWREISVPDVTYNAGANPGQAQITVTAP